MEHHNRCPERIAFMASRPPAGLSPRSVKLWGQLVPKNAQTPQRLALLTEALRCLDRADQLREKIDNEGLMLTTGKRDRVRIHPLAKLERQTRRDFVKAWKVLGLQMGLLDSTIPAEFGGPVNEGDSRWQ